MDELTGVEQLSFRKCMVRILSLREHPVQDEADPPYLFYTLAQLLPSEYCLPLYNSSV